MLASQFFWPFLPSVTKCVTRQVISSKLCLFFKFKLFLCFAKVCLSHRSQGGTEHGLGALQHSSWPDVSEWRLNDFSMNFHPDKQLFQVAGARDRQQGSIEGSILISKDVMVSFRGYLFSWFKGKSRCKLS